MDEGDSSASYAPLLDSGDVEQETEGVESLKPWQVFVDGAGTLILFEVSLAALVAPVIFASPSLGFLSAVFGGILVYFGWIRIRASMDLCSPSEEYGMSFRVPDKVDGKETGLVSYGSLSAVFLYVSGILAMLSSIAWSVNTAFRARYWEFLEGFGDWGYWSVAGTTGLCVFAIVSEVVVWASVATAGGGGVKSMVAEAREVVAENLKSQRRGDVEAGAVGDAPDDKDKLVLPWVVRARDGRPPRCAGGLCCGCCACPCCRRSDVALARELHLRTHADAVQLLSTWMLCMYLACEIGLKLDLYAHRGFATATIVFGLIATATTGWMFVAALCECPRSQFSPRAPCGTLILSLVPLSRMADKDEEEHRIERDRLARYLAATIPSNVVFEDDQGPPQSRELYESSGPALPPVAIGPPVNEVGLDEEGPCGCRCRDACYEDAFSITAFVVFVGGISSFFSTLVAIFSHDYFEFAYSTATIVVYHLGIMQTLIAFLAVCSRRRAARHITIRNARSAARKALDTANTSKPLVVHGGPSQAVSNTILASAIPLNQDRFPWLRAFLLPAYDDPQYSKTPVHDNIPVFLPE